MSVGQDASRESPADTLAQRPGPRLSAAGLTVALLSIAALPIGVIGLLWGFDLLPPPGQAELAGRVEYRRGDPSNLRAAPPRLLLRNESDQDWQRIGATINDAYYFFPSDPDRADGMLTLPPGETLELFPHRFMKRSGEAFQPQRQRIEHVEIVAQVESGARGYFEQRFAVDEVNATDAAADGEQR